MNLQGRVERLEQERERQIDEICARMFKGADLGGMLAITAMGQMGLLGEPVAIPDSLQDGLSHYLTMEPAALYDLYAEAVSMAAAAVSDAERALDGMADLATIKADLVRYRDEMIAQIAECQAGAVA